MTALYKRLELVEKVILETRLNVGVVLSISGCGILARAMVGKHDENFREARSTGLAFAHRVVSTIGLSGSHDRISTPQILVDTAAEVIEDPKHVGVMCTTWRCLPEGVEICSVGTNSVLVFEGDIIREAVTPHSIRELLRSRGIETHSPKGRMPTLALDDGSHCKVEDVRVALVPLLPTTTIAVIEDRRLADDILQHAVPRNDLSSFIESWTPQGKKIRTSVLISL